MIEPKGFIEFKGEPLFMSSLKILQDHEKIKEIVLVVPSSKIKITRKLTSAFKKVKAIVKGGESRFASFKLGLRKTSPKANLVLVHNAANPFVTNKEISNCFQSAQKFQAAAVGVPASSTVKKVRGKKITATLDRKNIWLMETPQVVEKDILVEGISLAEKSNVDVTDDIQLAELAGICPRIIKASEKNRKITRKSDLEKFLRQEVKIGFGQDSHRFAKSKKPLLLGGVQISTKNGLEGNSDGDVILHALVNAISSAIGGGSVSNYADKLCRKGIKDSKVYLKEALKKLKISGFEIGNISLACEASTPKLEKQFSKIKTSLAKLLSISVEQIGITATSGEKLTAWGRGEGIQVFCVVLLKFRG